MPARIRRDDEVIVISGKDRGKRGKVLRVEPKKSRVYVEGLNIVKRHQRPTQTVSGTQAGGVIEREGPIHISNVMLIDPKDDKPTRVGIEIVDGTPAARCQAQRPATGLGIHTRIFEMSTTAPARLKTRYTEEIRPALMERFGYSSVMQAPRILKITVNMGCGDAKQDSKVLDAAIEQLATITGQRPNIRRARKSIAQFKLREGMPVGVAVTLRGERQYEFLDRLMSVAIPRIRDFRGLNPRAFDGRGNYSMGVREQIIFPEVDYDEIDQVRGLDITITTTATTNEECFALLEAFGMPFSKDGRVPAATQLKEHSGKDLSTRSPAAHAEVQDTGLHPMPALWPGTVRLSQVRPVPDLPARTGPQRIRPRYDEVELVTACR